MKGQIRYLDRTGHSTVEFDTEDQQSVDNAKATFDDLIGRKFIAFNTDTKERITSFDPENQEKVMMVPPMAGG